MKLEKALTTTKFVLWRNSVMDTDNNLIVLNDIINYAKLMQEPVELGMFTACVDGGRIEKPDVYDYYWKNGKLDGFSGQQVVDCKQYEKAESQILFEECEIEARDDFYWLTYIGQTIASCGTGGYGLGGWSFISNAKTIEELIQKFELPLKPTQAFLNKIATIAT